MSSLLKLFILRTSQLGFQNLSLHDLNLSLQNLGCQNLSRQNLSRRSLNLQSKQSGPNQSGPNQGVSFQGVSYIAIALILGSTALSAQATPLPPDSPEPSSSKATTPLKTKPKLTEALVSASSLGIPVPVSSQSVQPVVVSSALPLPLPLPYVIPQAPSQPSFASGQPNFQPRSLSQSPTTQVAQTQPLLTPSQPPSGSGSLPPAPLTNPYQQNPYQQNPYSNPGLMPSAGYAPSYGQPYPMQQGYPQPQGYVYTMPQAPVNYYSQPVPYGYPAPQPMGYGMPSPGAYYPQPYAPQPLQPYASQPQGYAQPYMPPQGYAQPYAQQQPYRMQPYAPQPYAQQPFGMPGYGMPYGASGYGMPAYGMQAPYPNYAMPAYVSPMQAVTVLPPVAAPVTVRQFAPNFSAAPMVPMMTAEAPLRSPVDKEGFLVEAGKAQQLQNQNRPLFRTTALTKPSLILQGAYVYQGGESSARARLQGLYPLSSRVLFGATLDLSTGSFSDTPSSGFNINELYIATSLPEIPNLRFVLGQLDLTSYFDRNSFAKDGTTHFFNPIFQTNPALAEAGIGSRPAALVNWSLTDNIEIKGAAFSSSRSIGDFALNGFAGEVGVRFGNAIIRGTYVTGRADENGGGFKEASSIARGGGLFGVLKGDREESFGVNAEVFIPRLKMGLFGRYGRYNNLDMKEGGDMASVGLSFLDVFAPDDRLGLAYGQGLSNDARRVSAGSQRPDALEIFYDFKFMPNLRMGFSLQERNNFSEIVAGFRVKTEFDVLPRGGDR